MSPPEGAERRRRERSLRVVMGGVFATALLYAGGSLLFGAGVQPVEINGQECRTLALFPRRVVAQEKFKVLIARDCGKTSAGVVELHATGRTIAWFEVRGTRGDVYSRTVTPQEIRAQDDVTVADMSSTEARYSLRLTADGQSADVSIRRDHLGELPGVLRGLIVAAGAVPALIGLIVGFLSDIRRMLDKISSGHREA